MSSSAISTVSAFTALVEQSLRRALDGPTHGLGAVLGQLSGADPVVTARLLQAIADENPPLATRARELLDEARTPRPVVPTEPPVPHPLDYAWMFTPETAWALLERIAAASTPGELVLHLGTPALHALACEELPDRRHLLVDRDPRQAQAANRRRQGSAVVRDLLVDGLGVGGAAVAVADPPWYPLHAAAFVGAAAEGLRKGGVLLVAMPSPLTRPGIARERQELIDVSVQAGLSLTDEQAGVLRYVAPPFEQAAMSAAGIPGLPEHWRRADLWTLSAVQPRRFLQPADTAAHWSRIEVEMVPLRVWEDAPPLGSELLGSLVEGDVLASVSARVPERKTAALWTSRNRVFCSSDPPRLAALARRLEGGLSPDPADAETAYRLLDLIAVERAEHLLP
jgi:hypothetical protein